MKFRLKFLFCECRNLWNAFLKSNFTYLNLKNEENNMPISLSYFCWISCNKKNLTSRNWKKNEVFKRMKNSLSVTFHICKFLETRYKWSEYWIAFNASFLHSENYSQSTWNIVTNKFSRDFRIGSFRALPFPQLVEAQNKLDVDSEWQYHSE